MSIYVDKVHIYCDHENCDENTMIDDEEMGSYDFSFKSEYESIGNAICDYAFNKGWFIDGHPFDRFSTVSCPSHDKE